MKFSSMGSSLVAAVLLLTGERLFAQASAPASSASSASTSVALGRLVDWLPLFQTLAWPALVVGIAFWLRTPLVRVIYAVAHRIENGDSVEVGASGIKLASARTTLASALEPLDVGGSNDSVHDSVPHEFYLLHAAKRDGRRDKNDREYYRLRIWIDADSEEVLQTIESVSYHLHDSFVDPIRQVSDPTGGFALATAAWGQFLLHATVKIKNTSTSVRIERYIDF